MLFALDDNTVHGTPATVTTFAEDTSEKPSPAYDEGRSHSTDASRDPSQRGITVVTGRWSQGFAARGAPVIVSIEPPLVPEELCDSPRTTGCSMMP